MGWLGLDDTDHLDGGCTTHTLFQLIKELPPQYVVSSQRLVRLYPFAKQRTRGNAAVAIEIEGEDYTDLLTFLEAWWWEKIAPLKGNLTQSKTYHRQQSPTDPGMVWFEQQPSEEVYWNSVREEISIDDLPNADKSWGGHGRIGATAAISWPAERYTFEAISWRTKESVKAGKPREVDLLRLSELDSDPNTFMSRDLRSKSILISPRGNCPVLFGIRARTESSAINGCKYLLESKITEPVEGFMVFQTNQATDDHLGSNYVGTVNEIEIKQRGTVKIICEDESILMAFAESGDIKNLAQWLKRGDQIEFNGLNSDDQTIHLERLKVLSATPDKIRPKCPECGATMKSMGKDQDLRCPKCKLRCPNTWQEITRIPPFTNWVQPPNDSMRHLAKPIYWS